MAIKKIRVKNFKSFKDLEVELGNLNILIGANASGKSNFAEIFRFLRDIEDSGLDNAISIQSGVEYLRNVNMDSSEHLSLEVVSKTPDQESGLMVEKEEGLFGIKTCETTYKFAIRFEEAGADFEIAEDKLIQKCDFFKLEEAGAEIEEVEKLESGKFILSCLKGKVSVESYLPKGVPIEQEDIFPPPLVKKKLNSKVLLLETEFPLFLMPSSLPESVLGSFSIYDFDPKLSKIAVPIAGKVDLEEDGENLAIVLKNIMAKDDEKRKFFNLVKYLLPFVDDLDVERFIDGYLLFKLQETYSEKYLPASLVSDGTVNMIALIIALYFEDESLTIIEEPEKNIHPYLISKVVEMMEDASARKQIIVTTHNPEMVRYAKKEDILLVSRDEEGFSSISRPSDKEHVKTFLENGLRMEELYVDNFLET